MNAALKEASVGGSQDAAWGVTGLMSKDILPDDPDECRRRRRLHALRAMDRLGLLGEKDVKATLAGRPQLRWLADEWGARWDVLAELGRIGEPEAFEEALEWALENRPRPEQVRARLCLLRSGGLRPAEAGGRVGVRSRNGRRAIRRPTERQGRRRIGDARPVLPRATAHRREGQKGGVDHRLDSVGPRRLDDAALGVSSPLGSRVGAPRHLRQTRGHSQGGEIVPYVYGLVGFVVTIVLALIVLQLLL